MAASAPNNPGFFEKTLGLILNVGLPLKIMGPLIILFIAGSAPVAAGVLGPGGFLPTATGEFSLGSIFSTAAQGAVNIFHGVPHIIGGAAGGLDGLADALMTPMAELRG